MGLFINRREAIIAGLMACCGSLFVVKKSLRSGECIVWNRELTADELRNLYRATKREEAMYPSLWDGLVLKIDFSGITTPYLKDDSLPKRNYNG